MISEGETTSSDLEVKKFATIDWWDENGSMAMLHCLNPLRLDYILEWIGKSDLIQIPKCNRQAHMEWTQVKGKVKLNSTRNDGQSLKLSGVNVLDIGCGAGILSIPLARLGAHVTGIDTSEEAIATAKNYSKELGLNIDFRKTAIEAYHRHELETYDMITALEVIEHVENLELFLHCCWQILRKNGLLFISSISRTVRSFLKAIVAAEYLLGIVPKGMHSWQKFVSPLEIINALPQSHTVLMNLSGVGVQLTRNGYGFGLTDDVNVNYIMCLRKA